MWEAKFLPVVVIEYPRVAHFSCNNTAEVT